MVINIKKLILSIFIILILDVIFLNVLSSHFKQQILEVQHSPMEMKIIPAIFCYIAMVFGINYFVLQRDSKVIDAIILGVVINTVYETTNMTTLKNWQTKTVIIDSIWGGTLLGLTTFIINNIIIYI